MMVPSRSVGIFPAAIAQPIGRMCGVASLPRLPHQSVTLDRCVCLGPVNDCLGIDAGLHRLRERLARGLLADMLGIDRQNESKASSAACLATPLPWFFFLGENSLF